MREPALAHLDARDVDLAPRGGVRVRAGRGVPRLVREHGAEHGREHPGEVGLAERRAAAADAPQVELVRFADVAGVDHVAPVADPGHAEHDVGRAVQAVEQRRDVRGGVRAQHPPRPDVAGVPRVPGHRVRVIPQPVVVVRDGHDARARLPAHRYRPAARERVLDRGHHVLDGVPAGGRVGQVAQRQRLREPVGGDGGHGGLLFGHESPRRGRGRRVPGRGTPRQRVNRRPPVIRGRGN